jgi:UDP-N-acetylmuramoylalanine--D-glutamate ligase
MNQTEDDYLIYDADDEAIMEWFKTTKTKAKLTLFIDKTFSEHLYKTITWK